MSSKYIAFYLPQYHTIPENDKWWGNGFTEWKRLKEAKPIFQGHNQPRVPFDYYDLSDVEVMVKQAQIAIEYGIYGFCYYHYWFNGHQLLHQPLLNMLADKRVNIPFCLSWANEPWTRAWDGNSKDVLMPQEYGSEKDWEEHLDYLIPFFEDSRYIRKAGKPVFLIYRTESFPQFDKMIVHWNKVLLLKGYNPLYIVEMLTSYQKKPLCEYSQGVVEFEPMFTIGGTKKIHLIIQRKLKKKLGGFFTKKYISFNYPKVCAKIIKRKNRYKHKDVFLGAFPDWDNSPRFKEKGTVFKNVTSEMFGELIKKQSNKSTSEFLFINAWNEWTEGAYLEPDKKNRYELLEEIQRCHE